MTTVNEEVDASLAAAKQKDTQHREMLTELRRTHDATMDAVVRARREHLAGLAMQGILTQTRLEEIDHDGVTRVVAVSRGASSSIDREDIAEESVHMADALIARLDKPVPQ